MLGGTRGAVFRYRCAPPLLRLLNALRARSVRKMRKPTGEAAKRKMLTRKKKMLSGLCEWDRRIAEARKDDPRAILQLKEAFRQGGDGAYRDLMLVSHAWGLDLAANTVPTFLWHEIGRASCRERVCQYV